MAINEELEESLDIFLSKRKRPEIEHRRDHGRNKAMKNITINMPILYDELIQEMKDLGIVPSRSEAIRWALKDFLMKEIDFILKLQKTREKRLRVES